MNDTTGHDHTTDDEGGQVSNGNGIQKYINQGLAVAILFFVGLKWVDPVVRKHNESVEVNMQEVPRQTELLKEIRDQGETTKAWQKTVVSDHTRQNEADDMEQEAHQAMLKALQEMCSGNDSG